MTDEFFAGFFVPQEDAQIVLGYYEERGDSTAGEFAIQWHDLGGMRAPRLEVYGDGVESLVKMIEEFNLLESLNLNADPGPDAVAATLRRLGLREIAPFPNFGELFEDAIRRRALAKLNPAERRALGLEGDHS